MGKKQPVKTKKADYAWLPDAALGTLLFLATLTAYGPALQGSLLWDDNDHVTKPALQSLHGLWRIWFDLGSTAQYYPLLHSAFWLEHAWWGDAVLGYHLINVTLHALSAGLVVLIVRRLAPAGALFGQDWLAGFLFALHPVSVEAVAWISEQKSTLSGVFVLASTLMYLRFDDARRRRDAGGTASARPPDRSSNALSPAAPGGVYPLTVPGRTRMQPKTGTPLDVPASGASENSELFGPGHPRVSPFLARRYFYGLLGAVPASYLVALALFVLALLSKTTAATLPAALLVILWWRRGVLEWKRDVLPLLPWFAIGVPAGIFTAWVERRFIGAQGIEFALTTGQRILLAGRALWFYATKLVWPADLTFSYPRWKLDPGVWWQWLFPAAVPIAAVALVWIARKNRGPLAGFLIFAGTLFPALGFVNVYPFRYSYVADHFQYLASLGVIVPMAWAVMLAARRIPMPSLRAVAPVLLVAVLGILSWQQSATYSDAETLYRETVARNPDSWLGHNNLGVILVTMPGLLHEALSEYREALRIEPNYPEAHFNLGAALILARDPALEPEAIAEYQTALRIKPTYAEAHNNLGNALSHDPARLPEAMAEFETALRLRPDMAEAHLGMGNVLARVSGRLPDAAAEFRAALRLNPDYVEAHFNLGNVLSQMPASTQDAIAEYQAVLRIRPDVDRAREMIERLQNP